MSTRPSHITTGAILVGILSVVLMLAGVWMLVTAMGVARADVGLGRLGLCSGIALLILGLVFSFLAWGVWIEEPWAVARPVGVSFIAVCLGLEVRPETPSAPAVLTDPGTRDSRRGLR